MIIAIDFDGTIVEHKFPDIGKEIPFATEAIKALQEEGYRIILWTCRSGDKLDEAILYCKKRGVDFYCANKNYPEEKFDDNISRKINADLYIDDRNIGGLPNWDNIYRMITGKQPPWVVPEDRGFKGFLSRRFGRLAT